MKETSQTVVGSGTHQGEEALHDSAKSVSSNVPSPALQTMELSAPPPLTSSSPVVSESAPMPEKSGSL